jgi:hypothetical protein
MIDWGPDDDPPTVTHYRSLAQHGLIICTGAAVEWPDDITDEPARVTCPACQQIVKGVH